MPLWCQTGSVYLNTGTQHDSRFRANFTLFREAAAKQIFSGPCSFCIPVDKLLCLTRICSWALGLWLINVNMWTNCWKPHSKIHCETKSSNYIHGNHKKTWKLNVGLLLLLFQITAVRLLLVCNYGRSPVMGVNDMFPNRGQQIIL